MDQNRRAVLKAAAGLAGFGKFAAAQSGQGEAKPEEAQKGFAVAADKSRQGDPLLLITKDSVACKVSSSDTGGRYAIFETTTPPGTGSMLHVHEEQDEWWYVLDGQFAFQVGTERFQIESGASVLGPRGTPHAFRNVGSAPGKLLVVFEPAGRMEDFYAAYAKLRALPPGRLVRAMYRQFGMKVVGPPLRTTAPPAS